MRFINSVAFILTVWLVTISATHAVESTSTIKQTGFRHYSTEQGLSQSTINNFYQESGGLMWIATESGLNRLDGNRIEHFNGPNNEFSNLAINNLTLDSEGSLWVATFTSLLRVSKDYQHTDSYSFPTISQHPDRFNYVVSLIEQQAGKFWVVTRRGVFLLNTSGQDIQPFDSMRLFSESQIQIIQAVDHIDSIWLATNQGLYRFNKRNYSLQKHQLPAELNSALLTSLVAIDRSQLLVTSRNGAALINQNSKSAQDTPLLTSKAVSYAIHFADSILLAIDDQLHEFKMSKQNLTHLFSLSEILPRNANYRITRLFVDQHQKLWIGTNSQGAYVWDLNSINFKTIANITSNANLSLSNNSVWGFAEGIDNDLWIATDNGLNHLELNKATIESLLTSKENGMSQYSAQLLYILKDHHILWLGTADGIIKFDTQTKSHQHYRPQKFIAKEELYVYSMAQDPEGNIWIASSIGAVKFNPLSEKFSVEKFIQGKDAQPCTFVRYARGKLWLGYSNRLESYDFNRKVKSTVFEFAHLRNIQDLNLTDLYFDNDLLWVSFNAAGIYVLRLDNENTTIIHHLSRENDFIDNTVHSLIPHQDSVWASTHSGLVKINKSDYQFLVYDFHDGLPLNEFNEGAYTITQSGEFLFGGANGFLQISPNDLKLPNEQTTPSITSIKINDELLFSNGVAWQERDIQLQQADNLIKINLTVLEFLSPQKWQFEYWLTGQQNTSPKLVADKDVILANLPAGDYQFNVRVVIPHYKQFSNITRLPFTVKSSAWGSLEFKTTAYIIFALLAFSFFYWRSAKNKQLLITNQLLVEKERRLKLALVDKRRGVWDWNSHGEAIDESTISIIMNDSDNLIVTLPQYKSYVHFDDLSYFERDWKGFLEGSLDDISLVYRVYLFENWIWCRIYGKITERKANGKPARATGTWMDISKERESEDTLQLFKMAVESTRDIVFIADHQLNILYVNYAYKRLTGYPSKQLIGKNIIEIAGKRVGQETAEIIRQQLNINASWQGEASMPVIGAPSYPIDIRIDAIKQHAKNPHYVVVMSDISLLSERMHAHTQHSYYDNLTGLPNKVLAKDRLSHALAHAKINSSLVVLICIDLDNFDFHSKTLGKSAAREIIVSASKRIKKALNKDDTLARIDTDKFQVILENEDKIENISIKVNRIISELLTPLKIEQSTVKTSACFGVAYFPQDALSSNKLIDYANKALQQAKNNDGNNVSYYHKELNKRAADRLAMKFSLQHALENNQFYLVFQPKLHLKTKKIHGFEVFIRWRTHEGNIIYPSQFIKIAEEIGMIEKMSDWLVIQSFKTMSQWKQEGIESVFSINLNPKYCQLIGSPDYLEQKLAEYQLSSSNILIEINEQHFAENLNQNLNFVNELSRKGFNITLDDFGSGNTPLSYFKNLPINNVKMERNFIRNIGKDENNDIMLRSIIKMMNKLGQTPTAKGIEYEEQLAFLIGAGCHYGQGYYFSDPLSEAAARQLLINEK